MTEMGIGELLDCLPTTSVDFSFAYGSGAIAQKGQSTADKMVDFIVACSDPLAFHQANLEKNPRHYSAIRFLGPAIIARVQTQFAARVFYNTQIREKGRLIKYGVVHTQDLQADLLDWHWLYLAGRLHKPVLTIRSPSANLDMAMRENRVSAVQMALLLLSDSCSVDQFLHQIVAISYHGDFRMSFGEDKYKIERIVQGSAEGLRELYIPLLEADQRVQLMGDRMEQDASTAAVYHRLNLLPWAVLEKLRSAAAIRERRQRDAEEVLFSLAHRHDLPAHLSSAMADIVASSALRQTMKNVFTAGFFRSVFYSAAKLSKMFRSVAL